MQTLLSPATRSGLFPVSPPQAAPSRRSAYQLPLRSIPACHIPSLTPSPFSPLNLRGSKLFLATSVRASATRQLIRASPSSGNEEEKAKLLQVAKRLEITASDFKWLGSLGFWGQLVCTVVAAVMLSFSVVITRKISSPATFYATAIGIVLAFISVFRSLRYIRFSDKLQKAASDPKTASDPAKVPPRADVIKSLREAIILNLLGMGAFVLGMQATVGRLVAKALMSSANPYYQCLSPGYSPVLALDVFLVQASANTIFSLFLGLVFSLQLLHSVSFPPAKGSPIPRMA